MGRSARGEGSRYYVVYSDPLKPLDFHGWPVTEAFDVLLKQCGYVPDWGETAAATLQFRHADGPNKGIHVGIFGKVDHPREFTAEIRRGNHGVDFARENIMAQVLHTGLEGWRGETRDSFTITHGLAEQRLRNPEFFGPDGFLKRKVE
jgi:hypothetical protein